MLECSFFNKVWTNLYALKKSSFYVFHIDLRR